MWSLKDPWLRKKTPKTPPLVNGDEAANDRILSAVFDSLSAQVVLLDRLGNVKYASRSWFEFARVNGGNENSVARGVNYLDVCRRAAEQDDFTALRAVEGIEAVLARRLPRFSMEYACDEPGSSGRRRCFLMTVDPMPAEHGGVVITRTDITDHVHGEPRAPAEPKRAEEALREAEAKFRNIYDSNLVPVSFWHADGRVSEANDAYLRLTGFTRAELEAGKLNWKDLTSPESGGPNEDVLKTMKRTGGFSPFEKKYRLRDGRQVSVLIGGGMLPGSNDRGVSFALDLSERDRAEESLRESEKRYAMATAAGRVGVWDLDLDTGRLYVDPVLPARLGIEPSNSYTRASWVQFIHPEDRERVLGKEHHNILSDPVRDENGNSIIPEIEFRGVHKNGATLWFLLRGSVLWRAGRRYRAIGTITDITERKLVELALRESEAKNRAILEALPDLIFIHDKDGVYLDYYAKEPEQLFLPPQYFLGKKMSDVLPPDVAEALSHALQLAGRCGLTVVQEYSLSVGGKIQYFEARISKCDNNRFLTIARDITQRKRTEQALENLVAGTAAVTGEEFFPALVQHVAAALDVRCAAVSEIVDEDASRLRTLAIWSNGSWGNCLEFDANKVPCGTVVREGLIFSCPEGVREFFPEFAELAEMDAVSYLGVPLFDAGARLRGVLCVIDNKPLSDEKRARSILEIFAARAAAELERKRAEQALRESEERLARTQNLSLVMVTHSDLEGRWLKVPQTLCELLGYTEQELLGMRFHEVTHPEDLEFDASQFARLTRGEIKSFDLEKRYIRKDRSVVWVYLNCSAVTDAAGHPVHCLTYIRDISRRKQIEQALRESEERLKLAMESARIGYWETDLETGRVSLSKALERVLGLAPGAFTGSVKAFYELVHPDDRDHLHKQAEICVKSLGSVDAEYRIVRPDGEIRWIAGRGQALWGPDSRPSRILGMAADITERKRAEQALIESEERLKLAIEAGQMGVWDWNVDSQSLNWSKEHFTIFGLVPFSIDPTYRTWAERVHPEDLARATAAMDRAIAQGKEYHCEYRIVRPEGTTRWVMARGKPVYEEGRCVRIMGLLIDVTERKEAEDQIQRLKERLEAENVYLREEVSEAHRVGEIVGRSPAIIAVLKQAERVAPTDTTVLLLGETGTGKELVARAIHSLSNRKDRPLVKVNCAALPGSLIESELFGHERGAFTGAVTKRTGRFELADGATIFLDEIGELPLELQTKLLRVLQEGEFERLGSSKTIRVNVRVIAATNRDLRRAVREGKFREDLYYRLNVYPIELPPLRERKEDLVPLAMTFLKEASRRLGRSFAGLPERVLEPFQRYDWPGNVRELQNVLERAAVISTGRVLQLPEQWEAIRPETAPSGAQAGLSDGSLRSFQERSEIRLEQIERMHILTILEQTRWRIEGAHGAAAILGLKPSTLRSRMQKLGIRRLQSRTDATSKTVDF